MLFVSICAYDIETDCIMQACAWVRMLYGVNAAQCGLPLSCRNQWSVHVFVAQLPVLTLVTNASLLYEGVHFLHLLASHV